MPNIPGNDASGSHKVPMENVIYIDSSDFKEVGFKVAKGSSISYNGCECLAIEKE